MYVAREGKSIRVNKSFVGRTVHVAWINRPIGKREFKQLCKEAFFGAGGYELPRKEFERAWGAVLEIYEELSSEYRETARRYREVVNRER